MKTSALSIIPLSLLMMAGPATAQEGRAAEAPVTTHAALQEMQKLVAIIRPIGDTDVRGSLEFIKTGDGVKVIAKVGGLAPNAKHGFHIHEFGDLGSDDGSSGGDHFNPGDQPHAVPDDSDRHAGDLGNLEADGDGNAMLEVTVHNITLDAAKRGVLGRSVIVHAKPDDGGQPSGNAGDRIGGGVIGISKDARTPSDDKATASTGDVVEEEDPAANPDGSATTLDPSVTRKDRNETTPTQPDGDDWMDE